MTNKVVVITGATSGIGQAAAEQLAAKGARIVQIARDPKRGAAAIARLHSLAPGIRHAIYYADLASMRETKRVAREILSAQPRIDVLINNAGAIFGSLEMTEEGLERTFALNHMSFFLLTQELLEALQSAKPQGRIINTSSDAHASATLDFNDLNSTKLYSERKFGELLRFGGPGFKAYARSKLCNILFTRELAKRLTGTCVTANAVHPGFVATRFADNAGGLISFSMKIAKRFARPVERGAETLVYLASSPDVAGVSGRYFSDCRAIPPSPTALDDTAAGMLWKASAKLA